MTKEPTRQFPLNMASKITRPPDAETVITVRLRRPLHEGIRELAYERRTSINQLMIDVMEKAVLGNKAAFEIYQFWAKKGSGG
jgi:hypothetical protein